MTRQIPLSIFSRSTKPDTEKSATKIVSAAKPVTETKLKQVTTEPTVTTIPLPTPEPEEIPAKTEEVQAKTEEVSVPDPDFHKEELPIEETASAVKEEVVENSTTNAEKQEVKEDKTEEVTAKPVAEPKEEPTDKVKEEKPKTRRTSKKTADTDAVVSVSNKMTGATKLADAVAIVVPEYEDPEFDEWLAFMNEALLHTVFNEQADAGVIKVILSNLARAYDNATRQYAKVSANLEIIANKSYGLIMRQTIANSVGANEADRKRNGLHAPEAYKNSGKTVNLFAIEAGLRKQATEIQMIIKQIEFKKSAIIAYLTAEKIDASI